MMSIIKKILKTYLPYGIIKLARSYLRKKKRRTLELSIHLTDHCNLNCKGCDNFSPVADEKYHCAGSLEKDFKRIYELANEKIRIGAVKLTGGEPLLHPELIKILNSAGKYFSKIDNLCIVTNGILLLKQESAFWETCKNNNIKVLITKYPIELPFNKIEEKAKAEGVVLDYFGNTQTELKRMHKMPLNLNGTEDFRKNFELCYKSIYCIMLDEGKIYTCSLVPYIKYFNKYFGTNLEVSKNDYIDIYSVQNMKEIFDFLCKPIPFCRYCNTKKPVYDIDWEISKKEITEWV